MAVIPINHRGWVLVALCIASQLFLVASQDLVSCSGYVRPSSAISKVSKTKIDLSAVRIQLVTTAGIVKYEAAPTPSGYYIAPVYENVGNYQLRIQAPEGWTFNPSSTKLNLANGACNGNEDVNFELTGFRVSGVVKSSPTCATGSTPHGKEKVELLTSTDQLVASTTTDTKTGAFTFENVAPGSYSIRVADSATPIHVIGSNLDIKPNIHMQGYHLGGSVKDSKGISNMDVVLYSTESHEMKCDESKLSGYSKSDEYGIPLCVTSTDASGQFNFAKVPCGQYYVVPSNKADNMPNIFDISPPHTSVTVNAAPVNIQKPFHLQGYQVVGKVMNAKGKPIGDAIVTITSTQDSSVVFTSKTQEDGQYTITKATSGIFKAEVSKKGFVFNSSPTFELSPHARSVPDVTVAKIEVCGRVSIPHPPTGASGGGKRKILAKSSLAGANDHKTTDASGNFCFQLPASETSYTVILEPVITSYEKKAGLLLSSWETQLAIDTVPVNNAHFAQALLAIRGNVKCLTKPCDTKVSVQLKPVSGGETITTGLALASTVQEAGQDSFEFPLLVPGKYLVRMDTAEWCWEEQLFEVELTDTDINNIEFVQRGYVIQVQSAHELQLEAKWTRSSSGSASSSPSKTIPAIQILPIKIGKLNQFCLTTPGTYDLRPISDCFQFDKDIYTYSTDSIHEKSVIQPVVKKVMLSGIVTVPVDLHKTVISYQIKSLNGKQQEKEQFTEPKPTKDPKTLEYHVWAGAGDEVTVRALSKVLFYQPKEMSMIVPEHGLKCGLSLPSIEGRQGIFISGSVQPHIPGVNITVFDENENEIILKDISIDQKGNYRAGPLIDTHSYRVEASAAGFHLVPVDVTVNKVNFKASKLGSLRIRIVSDTDAAQPISGALLSMSGTGYRQNSHSNESGEVLFANIFPGDYYLMPLLKEYTFAKDKKPTIVPQHQQPIVVQIKEGTDKILLVASRVAYSCYGKVFSLNGQPEKGIMVEARNNQLLEQAQTDQFGEFRLRGLIPDQEYIIQISSENFHIERAAPSAHVLVIGKEDIHNVDFLAFRKTSSRFEVFGHVVTNTSLLPYITVQLWEEIDKSEKTPASDAPVREIKLLEGVDFFSFAGLSRAHYTLRLKVDAALSRSAYAFNPDLATVKIHFSPDAPSQMVNVTLAADATSEIVEVPAGQLYATLIVLLAAAGFYYRKPLTKFIAPYYRKTMMHQQFGGSSTGPSSDSGRLSKKKQSATRSTPEDQFVANLSKFGRN